MPDADAKSLGHPSDVDQLCLPCATYSLAVHRHAVTNRRQAVVLARDPTARETTGRPVGAISRAEDAGCFIVFKAKPAAAPIG
jgi:hypothetical protein